MTFEVIYKTYWQKVFRLCMGYANDQDKAKDLAQESFIKVLDNLSKFRNESSIETWIFRITTNTCLRQIEKESKTPKSELTFDLSEEDTETNIESDLQFLYQCISQLPEIERIIISLELEDINQKEIAKIVGISGSNVRVKIHRIKEKLTRKFKENE